MANEFLKIPKKYLPRGFDFIYEDQELIIGNKAAGALTVSALWNKDDTIHAALNRYVRKANPKSKKCVYVVHRLDQATTGVLVFAKSEEVQQFIKNSWKANEKTYLTIVHGKLKEPSGVISSFLKEDDDYFVRSVKSTGAKDPEDAKYAQTQYQVLSENERYSLLKIRLLTGRKNQIRVHLSEQGNPVVGDDKYGPRQLKAKQLHLHSHALTLTHPFSKKRLTFTAPVPEYFSRLLPFDYVAATKAFSQQ